MKIGRKEDMDVSDKMALLVLGSHAPSSHSCARSVLERTYLQFMVAMKICMKEDTGFANEMTLMVLGWHANSV